MHRPQAHHLHASLALATDLYQLTMAYGYWKSGLYNRTAVFHLFYRKAPFNGHYALVAGLEPIVQYLNNFQFPLDDIQYLTNLKNTDGSALFDEGFLNFLQRMEFSCHIDAMPEGSVAFPHQPIIRVEGPLIQAQIIETYLLNQINFATLIATKASRIVQAAQGDPVLEFGFRRAQGLDGALTASRAAFIGGCVATSNVLAGKIYGIPVRGTHAHSWVMCFEEELDAFEAYAQAMPDNCIFLVDTYDTIGGVNNAIKVGQKLRAKGYDMRGIRLDSGDLTTLSIKARQMLDDAGFEDTTVVASNDLDEFRIAELKRNGATINVWGVGTRLATAYDQPALGGVYKLAALKNKAGNWDYKMKLSEQLIKTSNPGILSVKRFFDKQGKPVADKIYEQNDSNGAHAVIESSRQKVATFDAEKEKELLIPIFRSGKQVYQLPDLPNIQWYAREQINLFSSVRLEQYPHGLAPMLFELKQSMLKKVSP